MLKYFINILFLLLSIPVFGQELDDEMDDESTSIPIDVDSFSQVRFGFDISRPVWNYAIDTRESYEFEFDYYYKKEIYFVAEGGWGNATVDYTDLKYNSSNSFIRLGISKGMLKRQHSQDWDMGFIGIRYGVAPIRRSAASYTIIDSFWGNSGGVIPAKNLTLHWAEIAAGIKVELTKGLFAGWTARAKFRLNKKTFEETLPPSYIAGYGKGEKGSIFDFNFYINYAIRWKRAEKQPKVENINKEIENQMSLPSEGEKQKEDRFKPDRPGAEKRTPQEKQEIGDSSGIDSKDE